MSNYDAFQHRHIGPSDDQASTMLIELGYSSLEDFIADVVPANIAMAEKLAAHLPQPLTEVETISALRSMADKNEVFTGNAYFFFEDGKTKKIVPLRWFRHRYSENS